jgi:hypothetical protein
VAPPGHNHHHQLDSNASAILARGYLSLTSALFSHSLRPTQVPKNSLRAQGLQKKASHNYFKSYLGWSMLFILSTIGLAPEDLDSE